MQLLQLEEVDLKSIDLIYLEIHMNEFKAQSQMIIDPGIIPFFFYSFKEFVYFKFLDFKLLKADDSDLDILITLGKSSFNLKRQANDPKQLLFTDYKFPVNIHTKNHSLLKVCLLGT